MSFGTVWTSRSVVLETRDEGCALLWRHERYVDTDVQSCTPTRQVVFRVHWGETGSYPGWEHLTKGSRGVNAHKYTGGSLFMTPFTGLIVQWTVNSRIDTWMRESRRTSGPWWRIFRRILGSRISGRWRLKYVMIVDTVTSKQVCVSISMTLNYT